MQTAVMTPNAVPQEVPLSLLMESSTNPRQHFEDNDLNELAETIRSPASIRPSLPDRKTNVWRSSSERGAIALPCWLGRKPSPRWCVR